MPRNIKAHQCQFKPCQFYKKTEASVVDHEKRCFYNPIRKACAICEFLDKEEREYFCTKDDTINFYSNGHCKLKFNCGNWEQKK